MNNRLFRLLVGALLILPLVACETTPVKEQGGEAVVEERGAPAGEGGPEEGVEAASTRGLEQRGAFQGHPLDNPESPLYTRTIYFDYDRSDVKGQYRPVVEAHAGYLVDHPGASVTLEGHTDERGTREYNLALGERRAKSVARLMELLGAGSDQIRSVSYGEERPAREGDDESAWQYNRRVEIIYRTR